MYWLFWTPTGISPANRSRSGPKSVYMQLKSRQRSKNFERDQLSRGKMGSSDLSPTPIFFVSNKRRLFGNFTTADIRQIWPWHVNRGLNADFGQKFKKSFHFSPYKTRKKYLPVTSLQPRVKLQNDSDFSMW